MKQCVFTKHKIQSSATILDTINKHSRTNCLSFHYSQYSLYSVQDHTTLVFLSGSAYTLIHVLISSDFCTQFVLPLERSPEAERIFSTYACAAGAAISSWTMGVSLSKTACLLLLRGVTGAKY